MTTPAAKHYRKAVAEMSSAKASKGSTVTGSGYELMLAKLYEDKRRLKSIQSISSKVEVKAEILPEYADWVNGALLSGKGGQDDVLATIMVWSIDAGAYEQALRIGEYVLQHGLSLPDEYERTPATVLVDEISEAALKGQQSEQGFPLQILLELERMTSSHDMPDQARAKLHRAIGHELHQQSNLRDAKEHYEYALKLDPRVGAKRALNEVVSSLGE